MFQKVPKQSNGGTASEHGVILVEYRVAPKSDIKLSGTHYLAHPYETRIKSICNAKLLQMQHFYCSK